VPIGNFLNLENSVFTKSGLLQKRNGFQQIGTIADTSATVSETFNGDLTVLGSNVYAYNEPLDSFVNKGKSFRFNSQKQIWFLIILISFKLIRSPLQMD
jgi:hypothetical protein